MRGSGKRLAALGLKASNITTPRHVVQLDSLVDTATTAQTFVMMHPNVATVDPTAAKTTQNLLAAQSSVGDLQSRITKMGKAGNPWATFPKITGADGKTPMQFQIDGQLQPVKTFRLSDDKTLQGLVKSALTTGVKIVRNSADLGAVIDKPLDATPAAATKTWVQSSGMVPQSQPYAPPTQLGAAGLQVQIKNPGDLFGTRTVLNGAYNNQQVPLKLYNNWVRWVQVYVQYLGANDTNMSYNGSRTWPGSFPDTRNGLGVGTLPQIFTVLGIPIWDTNTLDATLTFPDGAHTARLLFCGLGSSINQGDWTQYFQAGTYQTDAIAPKEEVLFPSLVTGIFTIGLTAFALAADYAVAASWLAVRESLQSGSAAVTELSEIIRDIASTLTNVETVAMAVGSGAATTADIEANGGSTTNIWSILLEFGTILPKLLFRPNMDVFWLKIAADVIGGFTGYRIANAIPFIGEVLAVISVLGDVATLAEECAETIVAPWVIENEVNLVYAAKVTVSRDPTNSSTWPTTARNWSLQANIDGAAVLAPITGTVNDDPDRGTRTAPLELDVQAPFGGSTIQWSFTLTDAGGNQVGTGVSAKFTNNDPNNTASVVAITFEQIPVPIDAKTTFERTDTTCFSETANGYTWSSRVTSSGTVADKGIQGVAGASISTLAGVAGVVWEQGDKFYVRGVPTGQDGATIQLGPATANGFSRRPFLLLDPFVEKTSAGNHVLLEPDETLPEYHVRKVTLDPVTAAPTWDPTVSYGTFLLPISAAALHSSGRVVAVNTDTGRLAHDPAGEPGPAGARRLQRGDGRSGGAAPVAGRRRGHERRDGAHPRGRGDADRGVRPQRQPGALLPGGGDDAPRARARAASGVGPGELHDAAARGELPRPGGRRRRADVRPLPHGRRHGPGGLPRRHLHARRRAAQLRERGRQRAAPGGRPLAEPVRAELRPARRSHDGQAAHRHGAQGRRAVGEPVRPDQRRVGDAAAQPAPPARQARRPVSAQSSPSRRAAATAWSRVEAPSLRRIRRLCVRTVLSDRCSRPAISR